MITIEELARSIEYTLLKPTVTKEMIELLCEEAKQYQFASVAVNPFWVSLCSKKLEGSEVAVCTGIGFPLGANTTEIKVVEAKRAVMQGAKEVDVVINIGKAKEGDWSVVREDIAAVVAAVKPAAVVKIILEACYLTDDEKIMASKAALESGADYVKTSTGFGSGGATIDDIRLMKSVVGNRMKIKAAGGIRRLDDAMAFLEAGADRIGTSNGVSIVNEFKRRFK
ncbi:Deoxyribose-phosphate aldolase [uncultured spirochete]|uniref:Deoxyribose-phosphate aldolase n=1 Tax=uncultured spirochete TaxID=156406 RepID=A0A3P3XNV8_9SPIR|nr:Deoxyribose-phosphate aldolase [uncultured spirochete]